MTKYVVTNVDVSSLDDELLHALARGNPYLFIVVKDAADDPTGIDVRMATDLPQEGLVKSLLEKILRGMP